ncbi:MAG: hypothetical protein LBG22_07880 [Treponema sp.]|jgi:uncharacterized integral membrane protein|nr:hypothetical protein [Treponema sp.]
MPWRLIGFILIFAVFLVFIAFNLQNSCDISLIFRVFPEVPVYLTAFSSFILGMFCAIPFILGIRKKKSGKEFTAKEKPQKKFPWSKAAEKEEELPPRTEGPYGIG